MIRAHKIRLNPTVSQATYLARAAGTARFVFNWGLEQWKKQYEAGEKPTALKLKKAFNGLKRTAYPWVFEVTKCAVEGAFMNLGNAFKNFFEGQQTGRAVGYPRFKAKKRDKPSFYLANDKFRLGDHWVDIPKLGRVNMAEKLRFEGKILSGTVSKEASWWFLSVTVDLPDRPTVAAEAAVGIDLGINRLATLSDGTGYENQRPLRRLLKRVKRASRDLSRKQPGSRSREKARDKLARLHYRIRCIRDDLLHKLTTDIARRYGLVGLETLNIKGMVKNHALAQALTDAALGRLGDLLESKVAAAGGEVQKVDRFFPSSKRCHRCHALHEHLPLGDRVFVCPNPKCGLVCDRDLNASLNLLEEASRLSQVALTA